MIFSLGNSIFCCYEAYFGVNKFELWHKPCNIFDAVVTMVDRSTRAADPRFARARGYETLHHHKGAILSCYLGCPVSSWLSE